MGDPCGRSYARIQATIDSGTRRVWIEEITAVTATFNEGDGYFGHRSARHGAHDRDWHFSSAILLSKPSLPYTFWIWQRITRIFVLVKGYLKLSFPRRRKSISLENSGFPPSRE